jgi:hypothetical protein
MAPPLGLPLVKAGKSRLDLQTPNAQNAQDQVASAPIGWITLFAAVVISSGLLDG